MVNLRHCLDFCLLAYELAFKKRHHMYKRDLKVERTGYFGELLYVSAFCNQ